MFFEDEKENLESSDYLDDIELDLDEELDDESVSWDELLKDDKISSVDSSVILNAQNVVQANVNQIQNNQGRTNLNSDLQNVDVIKLSDNNGSTPASALQSSQNVARKPDAFDVFGGDNAVVQTPSNKHKQQNDVFDADSEDDATDDFDEFDFNPAQKTSNTSTILGVLLAVVLVAGSVFYLFFGQNKVHKQPSMQVNNVVQQADVIVDTKQETSPMVATQDVPVVNDKEAKNLKAEKKIVVPVETTGRLNPFLPTYEEFGDNYYAGIPAQIIAPPESYGNNQDAQELLQVSVSGILFDAIKPSAIITIRDMDYFVQKGDLVDDYKVIDINRQAVVIKKGTNIYKAGVGERFNQNVEVAGSAVYQHGGTWQYSLANSDDEIEVRPTASTRSSGSRTNQRARYR